MVRRYLNSGFCPLLLMACGMLHLAVGQGDNGSSCAFSVLDVVFVVDASESITEDSPDGWNYIKDFVVNVTRLFTISQTQTRVGLTVFSDAAADRENFPDVPPGSVVFFDLRKFDTAAHLEDAIGRLHQFGGSTDTPAGLLVARDIMLEADAGDRPNVQNVVFVITDGASNLDDESLTEQANALKQEAKVIAVGVTQDSGFVQQLLQIATSPEDVVLADDFTNLASKLDEITSIVCDVVTTPPPSVEPTQTQVSTDHPTSELPTS